jgi:WD40 repeat protein
MTVSATGLCHYLISSGATCNGSQSTISHWQLRSLISSPEQGIVYYPHGQEIIALNTKTREREVVTKLSYAPRCAIASKDWVCCGGEDGNYTAIPLSDGATGLDSSFTWDADADARLPLDLDPARHSNTRDTRSTTRRSLSRPIVPHNVKVGAEIVNCITLWSPGEGKSERAYTSPVAVISNNDCSVSVVQLGTLDVLDEFFFPDCVNRSVISPDGQLLATICDDPYLYIHERRPKVRSKKDRLNRACAESYEWALSGQIHLEGQRPSDKTMLRGSFAACFSNSGKYFAAASQYGIISVFETDSLTQAKSLPIVFTTSRPGTVLSRPETSAPGAVRAMEFSPGPYDLLAWTESSGRFCVADVRNSFLSRQLIMIDPLAEGVERVIVLDKQPDRDPIVIDPRLRTSRLESRSSSSTPDFLAIDAERRQIRQLTRVILDRYDPPPFSAEETEVLHASQAARRQREGLAASTSSAWGDPEGARDLRRTYGPIDAGGGSGDREGNQSTLFSTAGLPSALREFMNPDRNASFRSFINERNRENERRNQRQQEPRRRSSMLLAAAENALEREATRTSNDAASSNLERLTLTPPRILSSDSPSNPWVEIDAIYRSRFPVDLALDRTARLRVELNDEDRRDFAHRLRRPWRPSDTDELTSIAFGRRVDTPGETMGCCWSPDGSIL